jgi:hypothetical protein
LPLLTSAHLPSASNHDLEYELAINMPIVADGDVPYTDTPQPRVYGHASPLDPQLFSNIAEHAGDLIEGRANAKYSPAEVAAWLDAFVASSDKALARTHNTGPASNDFRRLAEDVRIVNGMGRYYAAKLRAALLFEVWTRTLDDRAGAMAISSYLKGRDAWATMAERAASVYVSDISYGRIEKRRGHWMDRLAGIDKDVTAMRTALGAAGAKRGDASRVIAAILKVAPRPDVAFTHAPPADFHPGEALPVSLAGKDAGAQDGVSVRLFYRHVNHAERWLTTNMTKRDTQWHAEIPDSYTASPYPVQYYFELSRGAHAWLHPAFNATLSNQPYYAVWKRR